MASFCAIVQGHFKRWTGARNSTEQVTNTHLMSVLVAISIPIFTGQLKEAREATDIANLRAAYTERIAEVLTQSDMATGWTKTYTTDGKLSDAKDVKGISGKATQADWQGTDPDLGWTSRL
jgi:hypothetical protein